MAAQLPWDEAKFVELLGRLVQDCETTQNLPAQGFVAREEAVAKHVLEVLNPFSVSSGGVLQIDVHEYQSGRPNVVVRYPGATDKAVSFVGMHFDVVPADPGSWEFDPFTLERDGDQLKGRGTTGCLGNVAILANFMAALAEAKPTLQRSVVAVFVSNGEQASQRGVGLDMLLDRGVLDSVKSGPLYWMDGADLQPCVGTSAVASWTLEIEGKKFHSGFANNAINPIELAMDSLKKIQSFFYDSFKPSPEEAAYGFKCTSTMKPTQWSYPEGSSVNIIPQTATVSGDVRMTPFHDIDAVQAALTKFVEELDVPALAGGHGTASKYELPNDKLTGKVKLVWGGSTGAGFAADLKGTAVTVMTEAVKQEMGTAQVFSLTGSLPHVGKLRKAGYDVCGMGFGRMAYFHANNEQARVSDFAHGWNILRHAVTAADGQ